MPLPCRENEVLWIIGGSREGLLWSELLSVFPRKTLDRHLKNLVKKGEVERIREPKEEGRRGRRATRYRVPSHLWHMGGPFHVKFPVKRIGQSWVPASLSYKNASGETVLRFIGEDKRDLEEMINYSKRGKPQELDSEQVIKAEAERKALKQRLNKTFEKVEK